MVTDPIFIYAAFSIVCCLLGITICIRLWLTRDKNLAQLPIEEEWRRSIIHLIWLSIYLLPVIAFIATVLFLFVENLMEQDGTWHQTIVRDESPGENNFYGFLFISTIILFLTSGLASLLYARTRLSFYADHTLLPYSIIACMPFALTMIGLTYLSGSYTTENADLFSNVILLLTLLWSVTLIAVLWQVVVNLRQVWRTHKQTKA